MLSPLHRQLLAALRSALELRFGSRVRRVCIFGSWARGQATEDSDLDVAAVVDGLTTEEWREAIAIAAQVEQQHDLTFSPFIVSSARLEELRAHDGIGAAIDREGLTA